MDKKTSKKIDNAVSSIKVAIWKASIAITEEVQREVEKRLIQTIHDRWEYVDKQNEKSK